MTCRVFSLSPTEAWKSLTDKVQEARSNARLKELSFEGTISDLYFVYAGSFLLKNEMVTHQTLYPLYPSTPSFVLSLSFFLSLSLSGVNGLRMLGVLHDAVVFLLEQLYGSRHCRSYRFRFHKPEEADKPPINPHGSARAELHQRYSSLPTHKDIGCRQMHRICCRKCNMTP